MPVAGWCFVDHNTRQDAATRKIVRVTAARSHARRERIRSVQEYARNQAEGESPGTREHTNDEENDEGEVCGCGHPTESRDVVQHGSARGPHACVNSTVQNVAARPSLRMLESIDFDAFTVGVPDITYRPEYGPLLHQCKLRTLHASLGLAPLHPATIKTHASTLEAGATRVLI